MILTIIVPVFNIMQRKEFLLPTLRSVVNQTLYPQIKLLVVDDGSSDDTVKYVRSIQSQFESQINFEFIPLSQNLGKHHLLNEIVRIKVATPYLMILDSDDLLLPTAAEEMLKLFQENPQLSCVKTAQVILSDHKITHRSIAPLGSDFYRRYIHHFGAYIGNTGSIWSIEAFKKTIKNWDPKEKLYPLSRMACEDTLRLYLLPDSLRNFNALAKPLFIYRMHSNQWTSSKENLKKCDEQVRELFRSDLKLEEINIPAEILKINKDQINIHTYILLILVLIMAWQKKKPKDFLKTLVNFLVMKKFYSPLMIFLLLHLLFLLVLKSKKGNEEQLFANLKWWWPRTLSTDKALSRSQRHFFENYLLSLEHE